MLDQAEALRTLVRDRVVLSNGAVDQRRKVYTLAITSGKGGVGKTSLAVNLALLLSRSGLRVRLVDADFGLSNAEVLMGVAPKYTLEDVLEGRVSIKDAWTELPSGFSLLSSGSGLESMANINAEIGRTVLGTVVNSVSDGDVIIVDTAPGIDESITSLLTEADEVMVVTTPDPTSITDSYAAMKVLISRKHDANITLVANCCSSPNQASALASGLDKVCWRFLERSFQRHEYLPTDQTMAWAVRIQRPLVIASPHSAMVPWLRKIAIKLEERVHNINPAHSEMEMVGV